jgi:hypothetical protein
MKKSIILFCLIWLFANASCNKTKKEAEPDVPSTSDSTATEAPLFPILGWHGLPASGEYAGVAYYQEMADAGFTINLPVGGWGSSEVTPYLELLDRTQAIGIKIMMNGPLANTFTAAEKELLSAHPAVAGYTVRDEPPASEFAAVATTVRRIQDFDNVHPCYVNLLPNYANEQQLGVPGPDAYRKYVQKFIEQVPVPIISFDHYGILMNSSKIRFLRANYYENLEIIAEESRKAGKPFWAFALSTAHYDYPVPTLSDLRLQVYSNLAYGAQGIQYFTWFDPCCDEMWGNGPDDDAPVRIDGTKSPSYYTVQAMNKEIQALSKVFLGSTVLWTAHTGTIPQGCENLNRELLPEQIQSLEISGTGALVSMLENGDDQFVVIVNHDVNNNITVKVKGASDLKTINKSGNVDVVIEEQTLTPGDIVILLTQTK